MLEASQLPQKDLFESILGQWLAVPAVANLTSVYSMLT